MNIVIIGSGNIATHLAQALYSANNTILQVYSRTLANAQALANVVNSTATDDLTQINTEADLYIIAVSDSAIHSVIADLPKSLQGIVAHTSGASNLDVFADFIKFGCIYAPQRITKSIEINLIVIPFGIEGISSQTFAKFFSLIQDRAPKSFPCTWQQRLAL